jgi:two-component system NarL family response regulator
LGRRETQVLRLLALGKSSPQIGEDLHIATSTVDVHRRNIMNKLELHTVAELTTYALRTGLAEL